MGFILHAKFSLIQQTMYRKVLKFKSFFVLGYIRLFTVWKFAHNSNSDLATQHHKHHETLNTHHKHQKLSIPQHHRTQQNYQHQGGTRKILSSHHMKLSVLCATSTTRHHSPLATNTGILQHSSFTEKTGIVNTEMA